eukprot:scaffold1154_cov310-Pinguiococcus_pyrenoidosus.AAC.31
MHPGRPVIPVFLALVHDVDHHSGSDEFRQAKAVDAAAVLVPMRRRIDVRAHVARHAKALLPEASGPLFPRVVQEDWPTSAAKLDLWKKQPAKLNDSGRITWGEARLRCPPNADRQNLTHLGAVDDAAAAQQRRCRSDFAGVIHTEGK